MSDNGPTSTTKFYKILITIFVLGFSFYNFLIYNQEAPTEVYLSEDAIKGQQLFQNKNCISCHQLYGLGGYLGPDLTNIVSKRGDIYVKAMLNSGIASMPKFNFSDDESNSILQFLKAVDHTGIYPNLNSTSNIYGWVNIEYKNKNKIKNYKENSSIRYSSDSER